ncbi:MAG: FAD:protein FMN transferase [Verrucomicrobia bacterium]|nr:FAD:protein FMN transferase [Verrucomicrobiota bacterium]
MIDGIHKLEACATVLTFACLLATAAEPKPAAELVTLPGRTMGTVYSVKFLQPSAPIPVEQARREVSALLDRLEQTMSTYREDSEICRFGAYRGGDWFAVSADTARVVAESLRVSELTGGAFDVTVDPLVRLWGFGPRRETGEPPPEPAIADARRRVGWGKLQARLDPPALRKSSPEISVDLSAIAKGYAADAIAAHLEKLGATNYLVAISGDLRTRGHGQQGRPWRVGVDKPLDDGRAIQRIVELKNAAISTSGDYRNFFTDAGRRYSHVIDPRTGRPVTHNLASVTIVQETSARADALATGLVVLGPEAGYAFAVKRSWACLFILRTNTGFVEKLTPAFEKLR